MWWGKERGELLNCLFVSVRVVDLFLLSFDFDGIGSMSPFQF